MIRDPMRPHRRVNRNATMRRSVRRGSRVGDTRGRELRSVSGRPACCRRAHLDAVAGEHWKRSAARRTDQPSRVINKASRRRPSGVNGALAVSHRDPRFGDASVVTHILAGGLHLPQAITTSRGNTASAQDDPPFRGSVNGSSGVREWESLTVNPLFEQVAIVG